eukprot:294858-Pyramimonas_sp.AAC.1
MANTLIVQNVFWNTGNLLFDAGYIHHVMQEHRFKNKHLFYRWDISLVFRVITYVLRDSFIPLHSATQRASLAELRFHKPYKTM